jgi:hypothetical protein
MSGLREDDLLSVKSKSSHATRFAGNRAVSWLSGVIVRRTTDLLCIAIVSGGLLTAAFNLAPDFPSGFDHSKESPSQAGYLTALQEPDALSTLQRREITGDERAAWGVLIEDLKLSVHSPASNETALDPESVDDLADWTLIATDVDAKWSIRRPPDLPRMAVAVSERHGNPLICAWGVIRSIGEGTWSVSVVRTSE